jgi:hypothetical protein
MVGTHLYRYLFNPFGIPSVRPSNQLVKCGQEGNAVVPLTQNRLILKYKYLDIKYVTYAEYEAVEEDAAARTW